MSLPWVHVETVFASSPDAAVLELEGDELRHLAARRVRQGDRVVVFDARGGTGEARIEALRKRTAQLVIERREQHERPACAFVLASAIPKGERLSTMLQMLTQLGVEAWQPLVLDDSVIRKLDPDARRLRRILIESCKVARRVWALEVLAPCDLEAALARIGTSAPVCHGDREGGQDGLPADLRCLLIGPEAGFSEAERQRLVGHGSTPVALSPHNLRIETAAVAGATAWQLARRLGGPHGSR